MKSFGTEVVDKCSSIVMKYLLVPKSGIFSVVWVIPRVMSKKLSQSACVKTTLLRINFRLVF